MKDHSNKGSKHVQLLTHDNHASGLSGEHGEDSGESHDISCLNFQLRPDYITGPVRNQLCNFLFPDGILFSTLLVTSYAAFWELVLPLLRSRLVVAFVLFLTFLFSSSSSESLPLQLNPAHFGHFHPRC